MRVTQQSNHSAAKTRCSCFPHAPSSANPCLDLWALLVFTGQTLMDGVRRLLNCRSLMLRGVTNVLQCKTAKLWYLSSSSVC